MAAELNQDVENAWAVEAERRWQEIELGQVRTIPWEEVKANLLLEELPDA